MVPPGWGDFTEETSVFRLPVGELGYLGGLHGQARIEAHHPSQRSPLTIEHMFDMMDAPPPVTDVEVREYARRS